MLLWIWYGFRSQLKTTVRQGDRVRQPREAFTPLQSVVHVLLTLLEAEFHTSSKGCTNYLQPALETCSYGFIFSTAVLEQSSLKHLEMFSSPESAKHLSWDRVFSRPS